MVTVYRVEYSFEALDGVYDYEVETGQCPGYIQMVASNMQGYGRSLWSMQGMFKANGGCGYVKKPDFLLKVGQNNEVFDPKAHLPVKTTLKVTIYMGEGWFHDFKHTQFDKFSPPDFYARVGIAGVPNDTVMKKTEKVEDNWSPSWNQVFEFPLAVPELALLRGEVHEYVSLRRMTLVGKRAYLCGN